MVANGSCDAYLLFLFLDETVRGAADAGTQAKRGAEEEVGWVDGRWMLCSAGHTHGGFINRGSVVLLPIGPRRLAPTPT